MLMLDLKLNVWAWWSDEDGFHGHSLVVADHLSKSPKIMKMKIRYPPKKYAFNRLVIILRNTWKVLSLVLQWEGFISWMGQNNVRCCQGFSDVLFLLGQHIWGKVPAAAPLVTPFIFISNPKPNIYTIHLIVFFSSNHWLSLFHWLVPKLWYDR